MESDYDSCSLEADFRDKWLEDWQTPHVAPNKEQRRMSKARKKYIRNKLPLLVKGLKVHYADIVISLTAFYLVFALIHLYASWGN